MLAERTEPERATQDTLIPSWVLQQCEVSSSQFHPLLIGLRSLLPERPERGTNPTMTLTFSFVPGGSGAGGLRAFSFSKKRLCCWTADDIAYERPGVTSRAGSGVPLDVQGGAVQA